MAKLKNIEVKEIDGEEKIWSQHPRSNEYSYFPVKQTYLKCNACGKKFSLNYKGKNFEEAKLAALKTKWEHAEEEHHHQEEELYFSKEVEDEEEDEDEEEEE